VFFFYVLYQASEINTLHDKIVDAASEKYWEISQRFSTTSSDLMKQLFEMKQLCDCTKLEIETYSEFKLGPIKVRRGRVTVSALGFMFYCLYILVTVKTNT
jgi:hypothetical protein